MIVMMMVVMGCNSGGVAGGEGAAGGGGSGAKSLSEVLLEVGRSAGDAFYSFLELVSGSLGFSVTKETKKEDVGKYFNSLGEKIGVASEELEKVAVKVSADVDKEGLLNKGIREAVDAAKITLSTLRGCVESLAKIGDSEKVGDAASNAQGTTPADDELKKAFKAFQGVVEIAKKEGVLEPEVGNTAVKVGNNGTDNKDGVKILATVVGNKPGNQDAVKAAAILTTVSGSEMLASIVKSNEGDAVLGGSAPDAQTTAMSFAKGGTTGNNLAQNVTLKAAAVAGGIALRSLVKTGKLASGAEDGSAGGKEEVQRVGVSAVNKLLVAVEEIIKKTVKNVLEKVKQEVDKAREPKASGKQ
ncbi:variable large family protein [Borrelia hispanica]|uniref:variable large family protein n=1 Tax=Borrelia hispanica TaxID=40835 RepID=UPI000686AD19|nr:variable large family protein [Borrelia hispanica]